MKENTENPTGSPLKQTFHGMDLKGNNGAYTSGGSQKKSLYGVEKGNRFVRRFRLFLRNGQVISIPYALLPIVILEADKSLRLKAHGLEVTVKGRSLHKVEEWLNEEKLLWLKEANTDMDDTEEYEVFIKSIEVEGDLML